MLVSTQSLRDRAYLATLMNTGLRANEILRLRLRDVDLGGDWLTVLITKSQQEDRLPITLDLAPHLRLWLHRYAEELARPLLPEDHLFPARTGNRFRSVTTPDGRSGSVNAPSHWRPERPMTHPERVVHAALAQVGVPTKHEGSHTIRRAVARHFFNHLIATDLGYDGALRTVSVLLHHSNAATTETYLGLSSERERRDKSLRGQHFLTAMVDRSNVVPLRVQASHQDKG